jgi:phage-related protein
MREITEDIWEVRVGVGSNIFRILGFLDGSELVVLNHAFQKKTRKTPPQVIRVAEKRKCDYFTRQKS